MRTISPTIFPKRRSMVVEFVGLAGAGKTTLIQALSKRDEQFQVGVNPGKLRFLPFYVQTISAFLPNYLRCYRHTRWFNWEELRSMVYLRVWHRMLKKHPPQCVTLLDHGPVFRLASLRGFGPEMTRSHFFESWWSDRLNEWSSTLNKVIWLDAPDGVLTERIDARNRSHKIKNKTNREAYEFLARYRSCYNEIIEKLLAKQNIRLLRYDTNCETIEQIVDQLLTELDLSKK